MPSTPFASSQSASLEESLARGAARFNKVQPWQELVIVDERVITGQNPTSAHAVGSAIVEQLS